MRAKSKLRVVRAPFSLSSVPTSIRRQNHVTLFLSRLDAPLASPWPLPRKFIKLGVHQSINPQGPFQNLLESWSLRLQSGYHVTESRTVRKISHFFTNATHSSNIIRTLSNRSQTCRRLHSRCFAFSCPDEPNHVVFVYYVRVHCIKGLAFLKQAG